MKPIAVKNYFPDTVPFDDPDNDTQRDVVFHVKRLTIGEYREFRAAYDHNSNPASARQIFRKDVADEQEKRPETEVFVLDEEVIRARRISEMDDETRVAFFKQQEAEEIEAEAFYIDVFTRFVRPAPGQLSDYEGRDIHDNPEQFLALYGARLDLIRYLTRIVWVENTLSGARKKVWKSLFVFARTLSEQVPAVAGTKPATAAVDAEIRDSVNVADATGPISNIRSGSTDSTEAVAR